MLSLQSERVVVFLLVVVGVALQLRQYLANKSLSLDESFLALNVINRSFIGLFHPLDFNQGAPPLFLAAQKIVELGLGSGEYSLRIVPLLAACTAIGVYPLLARQVVDPRVVPIAVALFVLSDPLIYYSSTNKQYSTDVAVAVVAYWFVISSRRRLDKPLNVFLLAAFAALAPWISFPSLFIVLGISATLATRALTKRHWQAGVPGFVMGGACLLSLTAVYFIAVRQLGHLQASLAGSSYLGTTVASADVTETAGKLRSVAGISHLVVWGYDIEKPVAVAAGLLCIIGFISLLRRQPENTSLLVSPIPFLAVAAFTQRYPLLTRTLLFLAPMLILMLVHGMTVAFEQARPRVARGVVAVIVGAIAFSVAHESVKHFFTPRSEEELKPALRYLARHQKPTDTLYIYYPSQYGFRYYLQCSCAPSEVKLAHAEGLWPIRFANGGRAQYAPALESSPPRFLVARFRDRDPRSYASDFSHLRGRRRVWILYSDIPDRSRVALLRELDRFAKRQTRFRGGPDESSAVVVLYNFSSSTRFR
jgi:hypothetical protein